ncbi:MAG TPA: hypothetical protein PKA82_15595 [Pyrinomonadaceae bacterium]|nr:hypothetical protein [Pyrinomonadaceae bacterium]
MKFLDRNLQNVTIALITLLIGLTAVKAFAQDVVSKEFKEKAKAHRNFCDNSSFNYWGGEKRSSYNDLREATISAGGTINVDAKRNGGVSVIGEDRSDVLVRSCINTYGKTEEEAKALADSIRISTAGTIQPDGASEENGWSVSFELRVPRSSSVNLTASNGGIAVKNVEGNIEFSTKNGGVNLYGVAGSVKGKTINGGIIVSLTGNTWKGSGMDVQTTNGGVRLNVPANFAARVEAGTVNGGFNSNIVGLQPEKETDNNGYYRPRPKKIAADINGGGPLVRVTTTNGGVKINTLE